ncbi:LuxR C-terminal-related transcriptional regulator [Streptomyces mobaraensis]|uniref:LuxR C-terminal-related transcriptional regulator n=1 Tax=Streptomyces mobaraensis TaxID=35621 RepID=UPI00331F75BC
MCHVPRPCREALLFRAPRLYGREGDVAEVSRLLRQPGVRLLTVTGPAGVGKSVLAEAVVADAVPQVADEVVRADLAAAGSLTDVWRGIAAALGLPGAEGGAAHAAVPDAVAECIGDRRVLLVLDNCDRVASLLAADPPCLLTRCLRLRLLLTSRSALNVYAEHLHPLAPLPVRTRDRGDGSSVAAQLFLDRVGAHYRSDVLQGADLRNIDEICELLDGLPLAIEVTARSVGAMSTGELLQALRRGEYPYHSRFLDVPTRHHSLSSALSWGDATLTADERLLMRRLAVCESTIDLLTVQRLGRLSRMRAARRLDSLVHKSLLVSAKRRDGDPEFRMLTVVRDHYRRQLAADTVAFAEARELHIDHCVRFAAAARTGLRTAEGRSRWLALVLTRMPDLRTAVRGLQASGRHADAVRMLLALDDALTVHDLLPEAAALLHGSLHALAAGPDEDPDGGPDTLFADALATAGRWALAGDDMERASGLLDRAAALHEAAGDAVGGAGVAVHRAEVRRRAGDLPGAEALARQAVAVFDARREVGGAAAARRQLGLALAGQGAVEAEAPLLRAVDDLRSLDDPHARALALIDLARVRVALGRCAAAHAAVREGMDLLLLHSGSPGEVALALETTGRAVAGRGEADQRVVRQVLDAAAALRGRYGAGAERARTAPPEECPSPGAALALALSLPVAAPEAEHRAAAAGGPDAEPPAGLTPRQYQIAELVAEGMTNRQIARTLELSEWTVVNHLRQVMNKLKCPSRVHVARVMQQRAGAAG